VVHAFKHEVPHSDLLFLDGERFALADDTVYLSHLFHKEFLYLFEGFRFIVQFGGKHVRPEISCKVKDVNLQHFGFLLNVHEIHVLCLIVDIVQYLLFRLLIGCQFYLPLFQTVLKIRQFYGFSFNPLFNFV
jgi:hypothetical protein